MATGVDLAVTIERWCFMFGTDACYQYVQNTWEEKIQIVKTNLNLSVQNKAIGYLSIQISLAHYMLLVQNLFFGRVIMPVGVRLVLEPFFHCSGLNAWYPKYWYP